jgi:hypothetical protein
MRGIVLVFVVIAAASLVVAATLAQLRNADSNKKPRPGGLRTSSAAGKAPKRTSGRPKAHKSNARDVVRTVCARNLFKPACDSAADTSNASAPAQVFSPKPVGGLRLAGMTFDGAELNALIENEPTHESWYVRRGDRVCGKVEVEVIAQDHVILSDGKKRQRLDLLDPPPGAARESSTGQTGRSALPRIILPLPSLLRERKSP